MVSQGHPVDSLGRGQWLWLPGGTVGILEETALINRLVTCICMDSTSNSVFML